MRRVGIVCLALGIGACTQRSAPLTSPPANPVNPPSSAAEPLAAQPSGTEPLQLQEVRMTETAGQRSVLFRFSQPPEGIDYFPLREPSRLVIDVKGPIESLPQVETYNTIDPVVSAVRIGSYQGRMRLVVDMESSEVPPFSVDHHDTLLTAFIGDKNDKTTYTTSNAQVLFAAADGGQGAAIQTVGLQKEQVTAASSSSSLSEESIPAAAAEEAEGLTPLQFAQASMETGEPVDSGISAETFSPDLTREEAPIPDFAPPPPSAYTGTKISLDFKNADIHDVLRILADVSGLNIIATDDVEARVTLRLVEVPWDQALDVVLQANGLEKTQSGNVLTVSTSKRLEEERKARLAAQEAQQKLAALETVYLNINYVKATDVLELISREAATGQAGVALMSPRGSIAADSTSNVLILRDTTEHITAVRELVKNVDVQTPQVIIESYIVTASENLSRDLGIQWGYNYAASPQTGNPTGLNFPGRVGVGGVGQTGTGGVPFLADFPAAAGAPTLDLFLGSLDGTQSLNMRLSALETEGKARVISRPRVVTINNTPAQIRNRREVRVPVISGNTVVGGAGTTGGSDAFEEFDVGITLEVTPQISSDGYVLLEIAAESSELAAPSIPAGAGFPQIPDVLTRTASSNVLIQAGATFVLGGILQDDLRQDESGIPYLRNTPGIGWLFKGNNRSQTKDELLVFITPRLTTGVSPKGLPTAKQLWEGRSREAETPPANQENGMATGGI